MGLLPFVCAVFTAPVSDVQVTETLAFTDTAETVAATSTDFVTKFMNMDLINTTLVDYAKVFAMGFALATILILITYGVFKSLELVHI